MSITPDLNPTDELRYRLLGSFLEFTRYFYKIRTGRKFEVSKPVGRESHHIAIARGLTKCFNGEIKKLLINVPPRYGKTEMIIQYIAWCLARYADAKFIYVSYSKTLATKQTATIREIINLQEYQRLFPHVKLSEDTQAKDNFNTTAGGSVYAAGAGGSITGFGAGISNCDRFGGCIVIDDIIKPEDADSDVVREGRNEWYQNTLISRKNGPNVPIIYIGQRVNEADLAGVLLEGFDGDVWDKIVLPGLENNLPLHPAIHTLDDLLKMEKTAPYMFASQIQQNPIPAGGAIFKRDYFVLKDEIPSNIHSAFITCDTSETEQTYNDANAFSFWGVYEIIQSGVNTKVYALHLIDCIEFRCEPKDLKQRLLNFWSDCCRNKIRPTYCFIEKKSTGTTLLSITKDIVGLNAIEIDRNNRLCKTTRFLNAQPYAASHQISVTRGAKYSEDFISHMVKITANNSHRFDDIADTCADAVQLALIEERFNLEEERPAVNLYGGHRTVLGG